MTGSITLSSKLPAAPPNATAASLPMTWAQTWQTASQMTGLTLPGMIDEPGCRSGTAISASPVRGPEFISRRSLQILYRPNGDGPQSSRSPRPGASRAAGRLEVVARLGERQVQVGGQRGDDARRRTRAGRSGRCPTAVPPSGSSPTSGSAAPGPLHAVPDRRGVAAELLAERDRGGVHQVGAAALDHVGELGRLGLERGGQVIERGQQRAPDQPRRRPGGSPTGTRRWRTGTR